MQARLERRDGATDVQDDTLLAYMERRFGAWDI
jgi:hypothetical protein